MNFGDAKYLLKGTPRPGQPYEDLRAPGASQLQLVASTEHPFEFAGEVVQLTDIGSPHIDENGNVYFRGTTGDVSQHSTTQQTLWHIKLDGTVTRLAGSGDPLLMDNLLETIEQIEPGDQRIDLLGGRTITNADYAIIAVGALMFEVDVLNGSGGELVYRPPLDP